MNKKNQRLKRARKFRAKNISSSITRLVVYRSNKNIYAQLIERDGISSKVISSISSHNFSNDLSKMQHSIEVGKKIAELASTKGISKVAFDRSGFKYHGRVKAIADSARENGLTI
jgi:large subunit ribosomal protein L18